MKNQKLRIALVVAFGIFLVVALGLGVWGKNEIKTSMQDKVGQQEETEKKQAQQKEVQKQTEEKNEETLNEKEIEEVSFCGKTYKSERVMINNIDISESVAKISNEKNSMCKNLELGKFKESGIGIFQKKEESRNNSYLIVFFHPDNQKEKEDPLNQSPDIFRFDFNNDKIYFQSQIDAKFNYLGDIK